MVALENNNGDAISCIVIMVDSLARENDSAVEVETFHKEDCEIFNLITDREASNKEIDAHSPVSQKAREHLYSCNCNATIETTFKRSDGETLLVTFPLSDAKEKHPWLNDEEQTKDFLRCALEEEGHQLLDEMKPVFQKRMGRPMQPWAFLDRQSDTVH